MRDANDELMRSPAAETSHCSTSVYIPATDAASMQNLDAPFAQPFENEQLRKPKSAYDVDKFSTVQQFIRCLPKKLRQRRHAAAAFRMLNGPIVGTF